jgi:anti-sigma regulatory factor (Ser/Thr protein kinase)
MRRLSACDSTNQGVVWRIEGDVERVLRLRKAFREQVDRLGVPFYDVDAAELIYGELVANAFRHAKGEVEVRLERAVGGELVLVVRDHGPGMRRASVDQRFDPLSESGRGLAIVETLAPRFRISPAQDGGTVARVVLPTVAA